MKVVIGPSSFGTADPAPIRFLESHGLEIVPNPHRRRLTKAEIMPLLEGADGLLAGLEPLDATVLRAARRLRAIARVGVGLDTVDVRAADELGIRVSNTPTAPVSAVVELTIGAMIALSREVPIATAALHAGRWEKRIGRNLAESVVLIVGFGRIGRAVAKALQPFGPTLLVADPFLPDAAHVEQVSLHEGLRSADVVTLHASGSDMILDSGAFAAMKPGMLVLNSGRGGQVDEEALAAALADGTVAGAWLDVFEREPYEGPLARFEQVLLTPHMATYTRATRREMEMEAAANLVRDLGL